MNVRELIERLQEIENQEVPVIVTDECSDYYEASEVKQWQSTYYSNVEESLTKGAAVSIF